jgi:GalNAc-alpha-(1->4)-GalNAc-alpha-(1->3)-diNAcBac-PP-undecaprenol alpha-1,4-N-acetyl-D-galactosaminyltransferase
MNSGGAERVAATLVNAWADRGDAVTLVVTFSGQGECFYSLSSRVQLVYLADLAGLTGRGPRGYWARFWALRRLIKNSRADIVLSFLTNVNVAVIVAACGLHRPVIVSERVHPTMPIGSLWANLRRFTYPYATRVVMQSSEGLRWLEANVPAAKGVVIPNPVPYPLPSGAPVLAPERFTSPTRRLLLAVGRLEVQKGFDLLLESFAALSARHPSWDLVILGEGPQRAALESQAARLGLAASRVKLSGRAGNVGDWYRRADLYVMSSRFEGFPNTLAEAMAHGCAVVSFDCDTGPRDIIRHGQDGLLVTPVRDVTALAQALDRLMGDDAQRQRIAARAAEVRERYSMEKILAMWDSLFDSVARHAQSGTQ